MQSAGQPGVLEIILIGVAVLWLLNAFRRASILKKVEAEVDSARRRRTKPVSENRSPGNKKDKSHLTEDAEYVDYEIIE